MVVQRCRGWQERVELQMRVSNFAGGYCWGLAAAGCWARGRQAACCCRTPVWRGVRHLEPAALQLLCCGSSGCGVTCRPLDVPPPCSTSCRPSWQAFPSPTLSIYAAWLECWQPFMAAAVNSIHAASPMPPTCVGIGAKVPVVVEALAAQRYLEMVPAQQ